MGHGGLRRLPGLLRPRAGRPLCASVVGAGSAAGVDRRVPDGVRQRVADEKRRTLRFCHARVGGHAAGRHRHRLDANRLRRRLGWEQGRRHQRRRPRPVRDSEDKHRHHPGVCRGPLDVKPSCSRPQCRGLPSCTDHWWVDGRREKEHALLGAQEGRASLAHLVRGGPGGRPRPARRVGPCGVRGRWQHLAAEERRGREADDDEG
mmetsp:Transcript_66874/g.193227  ORF Transcript_66874/g.193227 Transcript_66874/m.193227 type:complete len:205 (+) Transcript_66874:279-893(+)